MIIRRLRPDEWAVFRDVRLRALADAPDAFGSTHAREVAQSDDEWQALVRSNERAIFIATTGGSSVGLAIGAQQRGEADAAGLFAMWVAPQSRGHGIGAALIDAVATWARREGYQSVSLGVETTNESAIALYTRWGFADTGARVPLRDNSDLMIRIMVARLD